MQKKIKRITIKVLLTIPALFVGFVSAFIFILKPAIDLWQEKEIIEPAPADPAPDVKAK